jgi:hypothetical protein
MEKFVKGDIEIIGEMVREWIAVSDFFCVLRLAFSNEQQSILYEE